MKSICTMAVLLVMTTAMFWETTAYVHKATMLKDCKPNVTGNGTAKNNEPLAKARAKDNWRDKAGAQYGHQYQHWIKSEGKHLNCSRSGGLGNRTWTCAAISQPCK